MTPGKPSNEPQWPPRSPHEALLSTPSGREKLRRMINRTSPSPSPSKRNGNTPAAMRTRSPGVMLDGNDDDDDEDEEDEEMLQLKLQAIQAQLKLKKLQKEKARKNSVTDSVRPSSALLADSSTATALSRASTRQAGRTPMSPSRADVQVPASPVRRAQQNQDPTSPSRVRLGIDKGLTARDISLKKAPSLRRPATQEQGDRRADPSRVANRPASTSSLIPGQAMTFGQRMQAARSDEASRLDRQARLQQVRNTAFGIGKAELDDMKRNATDIPDLPDEPIQFSREDVLSGCQVRKNTAGKTVADSFSSTTISRTSTTASVSGDPPAIEPYSGFHLSKRIIPHTAMARTMGGKEAYSIPELLKHVKAPEFELPDIEKDIVIFGIVASKSEPKPHKGVKSLKEKAGKDEAPAKYMVMKLVDLEWELDLFLFKTGFERYWKISPGTVIAILNPVIMRPPSGRTDTGKFSLVINSDGDTILEIGLARDLGFCKSIRRDGKVCDSWVNKKRTEFCEFHMNAALDKHQKARQDINAFNTGPGPRSASDNSCLKRVAKASNYVRDYDDKRNRGSGSFDRETQSHWFLHKKDSAAAMLDNEVLSGHVTGTIERGEALKRRLATQEKERGIMKQLGAVGAGAGKEYMRLAQQKKEGSGPVSGAVALSGNHDSTSGSITAEDEPRRVDARSLGLLRDKDHKIHLSPVKRKRTESALSASFATSSAQSSSSSSSMSRRTGSTGTGPDAGSKAEALGWGGGLKSKLSRMKEGEALRKTSAALEKPDAASGTTRSNVSEKQQPARKKTRFLTEKGIRIAGRESLGDELTNLADDAAPENFGGGSGAAAQLRPRMVMLDDDDDDDDLLILDE